MWWLAMLLLVVAMIFWIAGAYKIAGITMRIATVLMIVSIIGAVIIILFGVL